MSRRSRQLAVAVMKFAATIAAGLGWRHFHGVAAIGCAVAAVLLFGNKTVAGLRSAADRVRAESRCGHTGFTLVRAAVPPWIRGIARTEALIYEEVLCFVARRKLPSSRIASQMPAGSRFSMANGPVSTLLLPLAIIGIMSDLPLSFIVVALFKPAHEVLVHATLLGAAFWGLAWVAGDRSAVRHLDHVVNDGAIHLRVGFRWSVDIPKGSVLRCVAIKGKPREWLHDLKIDRADVLVVTPVDAPNVLIQLDAQGFDRVHVTRMGATSQARQFVAFYVDDPSGLLECVVRCGSALSMNTLEEVNA